MVATNYLFRNRKSVQRDPSSKQSAVLSAASLSDKTWLMVKVGILLTLAFCLFVGLKSKRVVEDDDWINIACIFHSGYVNATTRHHMPVRSQEVKTLTDFVKHLVAESEGIHLFIYILCHDFDREIVIRSFREVVNHARSFHVKMKFETVSLETVFSNLEKDIEHSRKFYGEVEHEKFYQPTFHFRQTYHKVFPVDRIIALDIDLDFRVSLKELYLQFNRMNSSQMIGIVHDQTPYYKGAFETYRAKHAGTHIGNPPPGFPGFNAGVVLLDLKKIRNSRDYNYFLSEDGANDLRKYELEVRIGDQDFYTLLAIERPEMFLIMDCSWNRQMDPLHFVLFDFDFYHYCGEPVKIYHGNGGSKIPPRE